MLQYYLKKGHGGNMDSRNEIKDEMAEALTGMGYALVDAGKFKEALTLAKNLNKKDIYSAFEVAAAAYAGMGDFRKAVSTLEKGVRKDPGYWINWELLGSYRSEHGDYSGAEEAYLEALKCKNAWVDSIYYNRAVAAARSGDSDRALKLLEQVVDPELDEPASMLRITLHTKMGRPDQALGLIDRCLKKRWHGHDKRAILKRFKQKRDWVHDCMGQD